MLRKISVVFSLMIVLTLVLSACAPQATPTQAAEPMPQAAPTNTTAPTEPAPQPTNTSAPVAEPTATTEAVVEAPATGDMVELPEVVPSDVNGNIIAAGSSTVYPLSEAIVDLFKSEGYTGEITIDSIGSGAGIERFCKTGETDIANASRKIKDSEIETCKEINRNPIEIRVGTDAIALVVNPENDFLTNVTLDELAMIYSDQAVNWADVNPAWPAEPIKRYAPGTDSGTYDFFIEVVMQPKYDKDADKAKEAFQNAQNLQQSEDDNVLVQGVEGDKYAIGFFGFAYYKENEDMLKAISLEDIAPSFESAEDGSYPLSRPLFLYTDAGIMQEKPQVAAFVNFYLTRVNELIEEVGYFPASDDALNAARQALLDVTQ
jgi:phosphate transport system substrate-binding protein